MTTHSLLQDSVSPQEMSHITRTAFSLSACIIQAKVCYSVFKGTGHRRRPMPGRNSGRFEYCVLVIASLYQFLKVFVSSLENVNELASADSNFFKKHIIILIIIYMFWLKEFPLILTTNTSLQVSIKAFFCLLSLSLLYAHYRILKIGYVKILISLLKCFDCLTFIYILGWHTDVEVSRLLYSHIF